MYPALPPLFSFSPSFLFSPLFLWEEPTGFTWKHQKITGAGTLLVAPGEPKGNPLGFPFGFPFRTISTCSHVKAEQIFLFVDTRQTAGVDSPFAG